MKSFLCASALILAAAPAFAADVCYQVSTSQDIWSREPELLCVDQADSGKATITLKTGLFPVTLATFSFDYLQRARCLDCNQTVYGIANPSNSTFNALQISFDGTRNVSTGEENGTVAIGQTTFYYRSLAN